MKKLAVFIPLLILMLSGCRRTTNLPVTGEASPGMVPYDRAVLRLMEKWGIPGGAVAVMQDGQLLLARGHGVANAEQDEPVLPDSLFRIASVSKPITAVAVLKLVEAGKLNLEAAAFPLLDDLPTPPGEERDPRLDTITVRHLLEHSGGWDTQNTHDAMSRAVEIAHEMGTPAPADCSTIIRFMRGQPLDFDPGSRYAYSNFSYCVLGRIVEAVSGQSYEAYVTSEVLAPAGIGQMRLGHSLLPDRHKGEVHYYDYLGAPMVVSLFPNTPVPVPKPYGGFPLEAMDASGGWVGSAVDLVRFSWALEPANPAAILDAETLSLMRSQPAPPLWEGESSYYSLGWRVRPTRQGANWWHTGSLPGSVAVLYRTSTGLTWAVLFNRRPDTAGDEFLVDVISSMGQATLICRVARFLPLILTIMFAGGSLLVVVVWKRRRNIEHFKPVPLRT